MGSDEDRRGAAYHEAGHAVVAWALRVQAGEIAIGNGGDDAKGGTDIPGHQGHLPELDQIAICLAGREAQKVFQAPTHDRAGMADLGRAIEIIGQDTPDKERRERLDAGYQRARELILQDERRVVRLATRLIERGRVTADEFIELMKGT